MQGDFPIEGIPGIYSTCLCGWSTDGARSGHFIMNENGFELTVTAVLGKDGIVESIEQIRDRR